MNEQSSRLSAGPASGGVVLGLPKDGQQVATGYKPLMRNPQSRFGSELAGNRYADFKFASGGSPLSTHTQAGSRLPGVQRVLTRFDIREVTVVPNLSPFGGAGQTPAATKFYNAPADIKRSLGLNAVSETFALVGGSGQLPTKAGA